MKLTEENVRQEIEDLFLWVHPDIGDWAIAPTRRPYVTYGLACKTKEEALWAIFSTFLVLRGYECAPITPEGVATYRSEGVTEELSREHGRTSGPYLYWRALPEVRLEAGYWQVYSRAEVSWDKVLPSVSPENFDWSAIRQVKAQMGGLG